MWQRKGSGRKPVTLAGKDLDQTQSSIGRFYDPAYDEIELPPSEPKQHWWDKDYVPQSDPSHRPKVRTLGALLPQRSRKNQADASVQLPRDSTQAAVSEGSLALEESSDSVSTVAVRGSYLSVHGSLQPGKFYQSELQKAQDRKRQRQAQAEAQAQELLAQGYAVDAVDSDGDANTFFAAQPAMQSEETPMAQGLSAFDAAAAGVRPESNQNAADQGVARSHLELKRCAGDAAAGTAKLREKVDQKSAYLQDEIPHKLESAQQVPSTLQHNLAHRHPKLEPESGSYAERLALRRSQQAALDGQGTMVAAANSTLGQSYAERVKHLQELKYKARLEQAASGQSRSLYRQRAQDSYALKPALPDITTAAQGNPIYPASLVSLESFRASSPSFATSQILGVQEPVTSPSCSGDAPASLAANADLSCKLPSDISHIQLSAIDESANSERQPSLEVEPQSQRSGLESWELSSDLVFHPASGVEPALEQPHVTITRADSDALGDITGKRESAREIIQRKLKAAQAALAAKSLDQHKSRVNRPKVSPSATVMSEDPQRNTDFGISASAHGTLSTTITQRRRMAQSQAVEQPVARGRSKRFGAGNSSSGRGIGKGKGKGPQASSRRNLQNPSPALVELINSPKVEPLSAEDSTASFGSCFEYEPHDHAQDADVVHASFGSWHGSTQRLEDAQSADEVTASFGSCFNDTFKSKRSGCKTRRMSTQADASTASFGDISSCVGTYKRGAQSRAAADEAGNLDSETVGQSGSKYRQRIQRKPSLGQYIRDVEESSAAFGSVGALGREASGAGAAQDSRDEALGAQARDDALLDVSYEDDQADKADFSPKDVELACNAMVALLSRREYSQVELRQKLKGKYALAVIEAALQRCIENGYQSDTRHADMLVRHMEFSGYGPQKLWMEAQRKGANQDEIENLAAAVDWDEIAFRVLSGRYTAAQVQDFKVRQKALAFLGRRGFNASSCYAALERLQKSAENG